MSSAYVLFAFARSGGTLINQMLGVHPECVVLSEINPAASVVDIPLQATSWLKLIKLAERDEFSSLSYGQQLLELYRRASLANKRLVVRDWVTVNFLSRADSGHTAPSTVLEQVYYLQAKGFLIKGVVVARRAMNVFASIRENFPQFSDLTLSEFAQTYMRYSEAVQGFPVIHLEWFRRDARAALAQLLEYLDLDDHWIDEQIARFSDFRLCTGNISLSSASTSSLARTILPPEADAPLLGDEESLALLAHADTLLGYSANG